MAKSKKSKILASMLAVSTMAVFYAAPVMAGDSNTEPTAGTGITISVEKDGTPGNEGLYVYNVGGNLEALYKVGGTLNISTSDITTALQGSDLTLNNLTTNTITVDGTTVDLTQFKDVDLSNVKGITRNGSGLPGEGTTTIEGVLNVDGTGVITHSSNAFGIDANGNVNAASVKVDGHTGGFDVTGQNGRVVSYLHAGDLRIDDFSSWNSGGLTVGDFQVANEGPNRVVTLKNHQTQETVFEANGETGIVTASGVTFNDGQVEGSSIELTNDLGRTHTITLDNQGRLLLGVANLDAGSRIGGTYFGSNQVNFIEGAASIGTTSGDGYLELRDYDAHTTERLTVEKLGAINDVIDDEGNVKGKTVTTALGADLDVVNGRTKNMTTIGSTTVFNNKVAINGEGISIPGDNGATGIWLRTDGTIYSQNGMSTSGDFKTEAGYTLNTVGADLKTLTGNVGNIGGNVAGIHRDAAEGAAYGDVVTSIEGVVSVDGNKNWVNFRDAEGNTSVLINAGTGQIIADSVGANNVTTANLSAGNGAFRVSENGEILMQNGSGESIAMTDGGLNLMTVGDNGTGMVTLDNGTVSLRGGSTSTVTINGDGATFRNGADNGTTVINGGTITASGDFVTVDEEGNTKYTLNTVGSDLDNLTGEFETTNANVAGIERFGEGAPGEGITTIEDGALFVSKNVTYMSSGDAMIQTSTDSAYMSFGDNMISINKGGINLTGSVGFTGHDGGRYTLSDLEGRVSDLEEKTQNIKLPNEPGQGGETGDPNVPATGDGHTGVEGDVTVGGDLTVNGGIDAGNSNIGGVGLKDGDVTALDGNFSGKVTVGGENGTSITGEGITVGDKNGVSIKNDEVRVGGEGGSYMNENDVVTGEGNSLNDTANRVGNLEQGVSELNNRVGELEDRIDKVGAMAAAIANLRTMGYDPAAPTEVAVGIGQYRDETGAALGLFHYPNRDFMLSLSVSTSGDEVMGGIGATWKFGRKSPEKVAEIKKAQAEADVRRAEEAKLAKAEEMKQAAKEAKIKAQQERHAKLAAERAAQAEAAK